MTEQCAYRMAGESGQAEQLIAACPTAAVAAAALPMNYESFTSPTSMKPVNGPHGFQLTDCITSEVDKWYEMDCNREALYRLELVVVDDG